MKGRTILLDHLDGREGAALIVDGQLDDLLVAADAPAPGTIYRARVERQLKGQGGVFVTTPDGPAFLRGAKGLAPGAACLVQVSGYAEPGKAFPVTPRLLFKSRYVIVTPGAPGFNVSRTIRDETDRDRLLEIAHDTMPDDVGGLILRSAAATAAAEEIAADIRAMADLAARVGADGDGGPETLVDGDGPHVLAWRDWTGAADIVTDPGCFADHGVLEAIDAARRSDVPLPGGGSMYIEPTRALVAVDVNSGADTSAAAGIKANVACARALPRALRVRGLGGQITLDLAPLPKKERRGFETALRAAFRSDPVDTVLAGWTPLGHFELQRKRARAPLD
ncbi:MAG: ribonuclease E/G [Marinibacterium sp.]